MFDFPIAEASLGTATFSLSIYLIILYNNYYSGLKYPLIKPINSTVKRFNIVLAGIFIILFSNTGDFFHMMDIVHNYNFTPGAYNHGEAIYLEIGKLVNRNYLIFRSLVWGGAFILYCWTAKRMNIPVYYAAIFVFCAYIVIFSYARATLAMAVYFFGVSFICRPIKHMKLLSYIIGISIISFSQQFHNSIFLLIMVTPIILLPLKKWSMALLIIGLPFIISIFKDNFIEITEYTNNTNEVIGKKLMHYSNNYKQLGIAEILLSIIKYISFYIPLTIFIFTILSSKNKDRIPNEILKFFKITFGIIFIASMFYFFGDSYYTIFYRVLYMSMIPICIISISLYTKGIINTNIFKWCYMPGIISSVMDITYYIYCIISVI